MTLVGGASASGRVLALTGREAALSWREVSGTLELKAFSMGPAGKQIGLRCLAWNAPPELEERVGREFDAALERLAGLLASGQSAAAR